MHPSWPDRPHASAADLAACRAMLRHGSRTFSAAAALLPSSVREAATSLYAFCRLADDAVDLECERAEALARLRERLERAYAGHPGPHPVDRALADVVARYALPRALPEALLEGFEWDVGGRRYESMAELEAYAARVAGTVGAMMAVLMGARAPDTLARACDLGVAMQLSNIARDVGEDARAGRLYLPLCWLREAGIDPDAWLAKPAFTAELGSVIRRLLAAADVLYARAAHGIAGLPIACRPGIHAARLLYAEVGRELERNGLDSVAHRAVVPLPRKARLLADALGATLRPQPPNPFPPLPATRFLVEAVAANGAEDRAAARQGSWWKPADGALWVIDLFERLERREAPEQSSGG